MSGADNLEVLTEDRCWTLLSQKQVGRLAVTINGRPDIFPVNYRVEDGTILIKTAAGLKLAAATLGAGIAFEVDDLDEVQRVGWSVVIRGTAHEIEELEEYLTADRSLIEPWAGGSKPRYLRIVPDHVTGRSTLAGTTKTDSVT